jgi:hypothetical protein
MTEPDTAHSAMITDHPYFPSDDPNRFLCAICNLSVATHSRVAEPGEAYPEKYMDQQVEDANSGRLQDLAEAPDWLLKKSMTPADEERAELLARGGHKDDHGKIPYHFLPWEALAEVAYVMEFGAKKYRPGNYRKGMDLFRLMRACIGHWVDWWRGEDNDPETGRSHIAHACCCCLMALETIKLGTAQDNRYTKK